MESNLLSIQIVLFHLSEHFSYPKPPSSPNEVASYSTYHSHSTLCHRKWRPPLSLFTHFVQFCEKCLFCCPSLPSLSIIHLNHQQYGICVKNLYAPFCIHVLFLGILSCFFHNRTLNGKNMLTWVQVVTASQVPSIGCRCPGLFSRSTRGTHFQVVSKQHGHKLWLRGRP